MLLVLWMAALAGVVLLSIWPFDFDPALATPEAWAAFWSSWGWQTEESDIVGNIALFVPVGFLGMLALQRQPLLLRGVIVAGTAALVALGGQAAQVYLEWRNATLVDFVWNMMGLVPGMLIGLLPTRAQHARAGLKGGIRVLPWLVIALWLAYSLAPFLPSLDGPDIAAKLAALWSRPWLGGDTIFLAATAWIAVGYLMRISDPDGRVDRFLPLLMLGVLGLEVVILFRPGPSAAELVGAGTALLLWFGVLRRWSGVAFVVAAALAGRIVVDGLWPFTFAEGPVAPFYWLPFRGILGGGMWANFLAITEKLFTYAAFSMAVRQVCGSWRIAALIGGVLVFSVEWMQQYQPGHVPEITDPLLIVLICAGIGALSEPANAGTQRPGPAGAFRPSA